MREIIFAVSQQADMMQFGSNTSLAAAAVGGCTAVVFQLDNFPSLPRALLPLPCWSVCVFAERTGLFSFPKRRDKLPRFAKKVGERSSLLLWIDAAALK